MKQFILILIFNLTIGFTFCQDLDKGINNNPILNIAESDYLNSILKNHRQDFDFSDMKTAFVSFDLEIRLRSKNDFFKYYCKKYETANSWDIKMIVLDSIQRQETNGYDVLILLDTQNKEISDRRISKITKKLLKCESGKPSNLYELGLDANPFLTKSESDYFNNKFNSFKPKYDFTNSKVGFFFGNNGAKIQTKKDYFDSVKNRLGNCYSASYDYLVKLTEEDKVDSGGYDVIIVSWSKIIPTAKERMINKLKNNE